MVGFDVLTMYFSARFVTGVERVDVAKTWWIPLFTGTLLSLGYLYVSSDLVVDHSQVHIRNPFREISLPLSDIEEVRMESNLCFITPYGKYFAWGVESANFAPLLRRHGVARELAGSIARNANLETANREGHLPRHYSYDSPGPVFTISIACCLICSVLILSFG